MIIGNWKVEVCDVALPNGRQEPGLRFSYTLFGQSSLEWHSVEIPVLLVSGVIRRLSKGLNQCSYKPGSTVYGEVRISEEA